MSSIKCKCGAITIAFPQEKPLFAGECNCVDCLGKLCQLAEKGGPAVPADIISYDKSLVLYYAHDKMMVTGNKDKLKFTHVREGSHSTNCIASCCNTMMVVDNPIYHQGSGTMGSTDGSGMVMFYETLTPTGVPADIQLRWWIKDIPAAKLANMPALPAFYLDVSGDLSTIQLPYGGDLGFAAFNVAAMIPAREGAGQTFAQLLADCGGTVTVEPYK